MSAYLVITYDVTDPERFAADYNPGKIGEILATIGKHGGQPAFAGAPNFLDVDGEQTAVGIKFPDAAAAQAWLDDEEYAPLKAARLATTGNVRSFIVDGMD